MNQDTLNQTIKALNETIAKNRALLEQLTEMRSELVIEPTEHVKESLTQDINSLEPTEQETSVVKDFQLIENERCYGFQPLHIKNITVSQEYIDKFENPTPQDLFPDIVTADLETVKRKCRYIIDTFGREQHRQPLLDLVHYHAEEKSLTKATPEELQRIYDDVCHYEQKIGRDNHE